MRQEREIIKDALFDIFTGIIAQAGEQIPVIFEEDAGTRPKAPFLAIQLRTAVGVGSLNFSNRVELDAGHPDGYEEVSQPIRRSMTCHGFGKRSLDMLGYIKTQLETDVWADALLQYHLVIPRTFDVVETARDMSVVTEIQGSFDFDLTYIRVSITSPGYIEHVIWNYETEI
ncbi:hypothetical protein FACS1894172_14860 [Spirochaetia bacterium]|nr:hypothetical protein FACS1894172_14860 [Spirochaetia bacterium]